MPVRSSRCTSTSALFLLSALLPSVSAFQASIAGSVSECGTIDILWDGGTNPFNISVTEHSLSGSVAEDTRLASLVNGHNFTISQLPFVAGINLTFVVADVNNNTASNFVTVLPGSTTACISTIQSSFSSTSSLTSTSGSQSSFDSSTNSFTTGSVSTADSQISHFTSTNSFASSTAAGTNSSQTPALSTNSKIGLIVAAIVAPLTITVVGTVLLCYWRRRKRMQRFTKGKRRLDLLVPSSFDHDDEDDDETGNTTINDDAAMINPFLTPVEMANTEDATAVNPFLSKRERDSLTRSTTFPSSTPTSLVSPEVPLPSFPLLPPPLPLRRHTRELTHARIRTDPVFTSTIKDDTPQVVDSPQDVSPVSSIESERSAVLGRRVSGWQIVRHSDAGPVVQLDLPPAYEDRRVSNR